MNPSTLALRQSIRYLTLALTELERGLPLRPEHKPLIDAVRRDRQAALDTVTALEKEAAR